MNKQVGRRRPWVLRALVGGLILGLPAGALLFVEVPVLIVEDMTGKRQLLAVQIRAGESLVVASRQPAMQGRVSRTFEVSADGTFLHTDVTSVPAARHRSGLALKREAELAREALPLLAHDRRVPELSFSVQAGSDLVLVVKGRMLSLAKEVRSGSLVKIRMTRQFWWERAWRKWWRKGR